MEKERENNFSYTLELLSAESTRTNACAYASMCEIMSRKPTTTSSQRNKGTKTDTHRDRQTHRYKATKIRYKALLVTKLSIPIAQVRSDERAELLEEKDECVAEPIASTQWVCDTVGGDGLGQTIYTRVHARTRLS